ncbi:MAG: thermonuclease family protein [Sedimentisphaerales bacterium]|nr:thermonuclease family protein [Sedimentisphaerales bacterium]
MRYAMSRRRRNFLAGLCAMAAIVTIVLDYSCVNRQPVRPAQSVESQKATDIQKYDGRQFTVVKVIDGDTLDIDIPDANYNHTRVRLWGVDTPETKNPRTGPMFFGKEAAEFSTTKALNKKVVVYLEKDGNTRDKYNRLLAYVQLPDGTYLNERLLTEGCAYADVRFKHSFYNKYRQLETLARSQKKGLWRNITEDQMPRWRQKREGLAAEVNN